MTSTLNDAHTDVTAPPLPTKEPCVHPSCQLTNEELSEALRALALPFELALIQWRVTEWSEDGTRGLMMTYADPRAYSDRLNDLFTPAGWSRKYAVQTSALVQRSKRVGRQEAYARDFLYEVTVRSLPPIRRLFSS